MSRNADALLNEAEWGRLTKTYPAATGENITYTWDDVTSGNKGKGRLTKVQDRETGDDRETGHTPFPETGPDPAQIVLFLFLN